MFEVITTLLSYQTNTHFHQGIVKTCGIKLYEDIYTFFETECDGGHSICWGLLFLGHAVDVLSSQMKTVACISNIFTCVCIYLLPLGIHVGGLFVSDRHSVHDGDLRLACDDLACRCPRAAITTSI